MGFTNRAVLIGKIVGDPMFKYLPNGIAKCRFTMSLEYSMELIDDDCIDQPASVDVFVYGETVEKYARYFQTDTKVLVDGRLIQINDDEDVEKIKKLVVIAESVDFLSDIINHEDERFD